MFTHYNDNGMIWTLREGVAELIRNHLVRRLDNVAGDPALDLRKDNNVRSVFRCRTGLPAYPEVFIKRYKNPGLRNALKYMLVPSKAAAEWRMLKTFERKSLPCPVPLAFAEKRFCGILADSFLITASLEPAAALNEYIEHRAAGPRSAGFLHTKRALAAALADLISRLHHAGVFYRDLHAGNILIRIRDRDVPDLFLIDLHRALVLPGLLRWMRIRDLAQLCNSLPCSQTDKLRFLKAYCPDAQGALVGLQRAVQGKRIQLEKRRIKSRSKRCLINSSVFETVRSWRERYCGRKDFGRAAARQVIALHAAERKNALTAVIKSSSKSVLTVHTLQTTSALCVKGYRFLGIAYCLKNLFRKSRAMKSWIAANALLVRGIPTPLPLAVVEKKWGPFPGESFFVSGWLQNALELNNYVRMRLSASSRPVRNAFIQACARTMRAMHARGIYHADLKSNNILVTENAPGSWNFYFIDLDRVTFSDHITFYQRANNLAQINASVSAVITLKDRLKFFRIYAQGTPVHKDRKKYYRTILEISRTKITKPYGISFTKPDTHHENSAPLQ